VAVVTIVQTAEVAAGDTYAPMPWRRSSS
jgi:hypothetical protein